MKAKLLIACTLLFSLFQVNAQVGIGTTSPNTSAMLDIQSTTSGMLIPRMTLVERGAIVSPAVGLQIYNTTNNTLDIYTGGTWKSFVYSKDSNLVYVYSLADLPTPVGAAIPLDGTKMYVFSGVVDISPNYIMMNGAGLRGTDPQKDMVASNVSGGVLRSENTSIFIENLAVAPLNNITKAYDFSDNTKSEFCNIFSGSSVVEINGPSLGVGQISGFKVITFSKNYWKVTDGIKITGDVGKFVAAYTFIEGLTSGSAMEFLPGLTIDDIDLSNNYFVYTGQTGIKVNGATVTRGRLTTNMFKGVTTPLSGIDSYTKGWSMRQNTHIPDSRAFSFIYFNDNSTSTLITAAGTFYKIAGATTVVNQKRFIATNNRITYRDVQPIVGKIFVTIGAKAPSNNSDFSIGIAKNGAIISAPIASMAAATNNQSFQITLNTEVDLVFDDYIEVFIKNNNSNASIVVQELQFRVTD